MEGGREGGRKGGGTNERREKRQPFKWCILNCYNNKIPKLSIPIVEENNTFFRIILSLFRLISTMKHLL